MFSLYLGKQVQFAFGEVVKDEMVFEAVDDQVRVVKGFLFGNEFNIFLDPLLHLPHLLLLLSQMEIVRSG